MNAYDKEEFGIMKSDINWIKEASKQQNAGIKDLNSKLDDFILSSPNKFACKETENIVESLNKRIAYVSGGIAVIFLIIQLAMRFI